MLSREDLDTNAALYGEDDEVIQDVIPEEGVNVATPIEGNDDAEKDDDEIEEHDFPSDEVATNTNEKSDSTDCGDDDCDDNPIGYDEDSQPEVVLPSITEMTTDDDTVEVPDNMTQEEMETTLKATTVIHIGVAKVLEKLRILTTEEYVGVVNKKIENEFNALSEDGAEGVLEAIDKENMVVDNTPPKEEFTYEPLDTTIDGEEEIGESCKPKMRTMAEVQSQVKKATETKPECKSEDSDKSEDEEEFEECSKSDE